MTSPLLDFLQSAFSLKIRLVFISSSPIANHDVILTVLTAHGFAARVKGFACSNFAKKNKEAACSLVPLDCLQSSFSLKIRLVLISSSACSNSAKKNKRLLAVSLFDKYPDQHSVLFCLVGWKRIEVNIRLVTVTYPRRTGGKNGNRMSMSALLFDIQD